MGLPLSNPPETAPTVQTIDPSIALEGTGDERPVHPVSRRHGADRAYRTTAQSAGALTLVLMGLIGLFLDRKSTRLNSSHIPLSRMPSSA